VLFRSQLGVASSEIAAPQHSDQDILLDDIRLPPDPMTGSSSTIIGMKPGGKTPSDSDVRLVPDSERGSKSASDSDVRLSPVGMRPSDSDVTLVSGTSSGMSSSMELLTNPKAQQTGETRQTKTPQIGSSGDIKRGEGEDSDFELTPSSVIDALQPESGSDFELTALDASDEFDAAAPPPRRGPSDSDVTGALPSASGINLGRPSDSGINLQAAGDYDFSRSESIELEGIEGLSAAAPAAPAAKPAPADKKRDRKADLSGTSLPIKKGEKDIFEDTDFEVDALEGDGSTDDRTVQLEAASDFDLEDSDSASEVFAIDEEDVDQNAATAMAPAVLDEDEGAFGDEAEEGISGETDSAWDVEGEATPSTAGRAASPVLAGSAAQAEWGGLWVGLLGVATFFMLLLAFVGMDLVRNLYDFQEGGAASGLAKTLAGLMGG